VQAYGPGILGYLATLLRDDEAAREAFSEFGEELWKSLPRFAHKSTVKTWAYSIAYHCGLRYRQAQARRRTRPLRTSEYSKLAASIEAASRSFSRSAADRKLDVLRRTLTDEEQTLLVLRLDRQMAWDEIAQVLGPEGVEVAALRKRFQRLKERLRAAAEREGLVPPKTP
jgi:RNA polymerase sigma-70 factor (ECF subfamily)